MKNQDFEPNFIKPDSVDGPKNDFGAVDSTHPSVQPSPANAAPKKSLIIILAIIAWTALTCVITVLVMAYVSKPCKCETTTCTDSEKIIEDIKETEDSGTPAEPTTESGAKPEEVEKSPEALALQNFLNSQLGLPLHSFAFVENGQPKYAKDLLVSESDRAMLIRSVAMQKSIAKEDDAKDCQTGLYVTKEEYATLYKQLFGGDFNFNANASYGDAGGFTNIPCACTCTIAERPNGYYHWNNTYLPYPRLNFVVEVASDGHASGKILSGGSFENPEEPFKEAGNFVLEYGKSGSDYFIKSLSTSNS